MRKQLLFAIGLSVLALTGVRAEEAPQGNLMELHSCELFAGGCVVSSESTLGGRYMLRVWNFTGGSFQGVDFAGLQVALLQSSSENLAAPKSNPGDAVAYLCETATSAQRQAATAKFKTRVVPFQFESTRSGVTVSAGNAGKYFSVTTASLESCDVGSCGESLWYNPRTATRVFTVAVDKSSRVAEPSLKLHWNDSDKRNIFLAKFGGSTPARNAYVTTDVLCGPAGKLF
jgi:hypothetical protein